MKIIYFLVICGLVYEIYRRTKNYNNLYHSSKNLLLEYYVQLVLEKINYLKSIETQINYTEIFKTITSGLKNKLTLLPKGIQSEVWSSVVQKHDQQQSRAIGVWGRAILYNNIKNALGIKD